MTITEAIMKGCGMRESVGSPLCDGKECICDECHLKIEYVKRGRAEREKEIVQMIDNIESKECFDKIIESEEKDSPITYKDYKSFDKRKKNKGLFDVCLKGVMFETLRELKAKIQEVIGRCNFCYGRITDVGIFTKQYVCKKCGRKK